MLTKADKIAVLQRSVRDPLFFYEECLRVRNKEQQLVPLRLNAPQKIIHEALEKQLAETGKVRAIILKSRRVGASTLIAARYYRYATLREGQSVAIVAHIQKTTGTLYRMVKRFQEHNPVAPRVGASNIRELVFDKLDSRYGVFSAETGEAGRGEDINLVHASEFAYYGKPQDFMNGLVAAVPDKPNTEIIMESTASGPTGEFYEMWQDAKAGRNEYVPIFVPWTADPDCYRDPPADFEVEQDRIDPAFPSEQELVDEYGLSIGQLAWRRATMQGPRNIWRFVREYPMTEDDAFSAANAYSLIDPVSVMRARKAKLQPIGDRVIGVDPAGQGEDRFAIACRQGNVVKWIRYRKKVSVNEAVAWIKSIIEDERPIAVFIDEGGGGNGAAICSLLKEDAVASPLIRPVNFGSRSQAKMARPDKPGPSNRRAEIWGRLRDWLAGDITSSLPDDEDLSKDLATAIVKEMPNGDWRLESKKGAISPDLGDAIALTFSNRHISRAEPAARQDDARKFTASGRGTGGSDRAGTWMGA